MDEADEAMQMQGVDPNQYGEGLEESSSSFVALSDQIGQHLVRRGAVTGATLSAALDRQLISRLRLGDDLIGSGEVRAFDFYRALAEQKRRPFVNLLLTPPDSDLLDAEDLDFYLQNQCLPWRTRGTAPSYVAVDIDKAAAALRERTGRPFLLYQTAPLDILRTIQSVFASTLTERAQFSLLKSTPDASAQRLLFPIHRMALCLGCCLLIALSMLFPMAILLAFNAVTVVAFMALAFMRLMSVRFARAPYQKMNELNTRRAEHDLPLYTIMVPLLQEADVLPILMDAIDKLDYPPAKLDIKLVLEETDDTTIQAAQSMALPGNVELIIVPTSAPMTKPKACNYALAFARGEFLVVYDAEDIPGLGQLREAVDAFATGGPQLACVQAPLAYYNWNENWLTRHFAIEYAANFDLLLPALARFGLPFPLGGTSTHFRTAVLRKVGAWDPFNVTEDADLGYRLYQQGYATDVISTATLEEANCLLPNWVRQRSRWLKGWMQTYIVRMRQPLRTLSDLGPAGFMVLQIVTGGFLLSAFAHPFFYLLLAWVVAHGLGSSETIGTVVLTLLNLSVLFVGFGAAILAGLVGAKSRGLSGLAGHALTTPAYWLLISMGAVKALYQLVAHPHYWEKTVHGVSAMVPVYVARAQRAKFTKR